VRIRAWAGRSPVREYRPPGSVRGALGNRRPYLGKAKIRAESALVYLVGTKGRSIPQRKLKAGGISELAQPPTNSISTPQSH
jgi:hypothetical protein